ncbi:PREDICTED: uncharacterized protein LOC101304044 [Fragaria vesca subsp. vesca]|uniref:uncharacterized protein LOC101304044 n=1 Tax=Fragaria vesca subsp. vesca TaxID=101020 RepID=UPI0002C2F7EC|nr:PREDICTED: uncharacterized protein LOC101304044 [Fragaria vesca subsp. vesca]
MQMEKKRKQDHKVSSTSTSQEPETGHHILSKDDQNQDNAEPLTKSTNIDSPSNGNVPSLSHQYPVTFPWPYTPHHGGEQSPLVSRPFVATQSPLPGALSQWPQFPHQVQYGQPPRTYPQSAAPFWLPQPPGYPLPASNAPSTLQPFVAVGATDVSGGSSTTNQPQVPNFYYHAGYPYPGFPGTCDSSSWWNQAQAPQHLCTYAFPGSSPPASLPSCSTALGQAVGKGIIRPPAKLSNKHQQLWDAQSAENVQLWSAVNHLQSEVSDYKNRLARLEAELSSLKAVGEETTTQVSEAVLYAKPSKRGRPKRSVASADAVHSPNKPHRRARGRKPPVPAVCSAQQFDSKSHLFEKVILNKVEDKQKALHLAAAVEQGNNASHVVTHSCGNMEINGTSSTMPAVHYQFQQELRGVQTCGNGSASSEMKGTDVKANNTTYPIFPQNIPWPYNNTSEIEGNDPNIGTNGLYNSGIVISQGGQVIPGWSFVNEADTSDRLEDTVLGSGKNDNEEIMGGDESSSGAEKIARINNEGGFNMEDREGTSNNSLAPPNN